MLTEEVESMGLRAVRRTGIPRGSCWTRPPPFTSLSSTTRSEGRGRGSRGRMRRRASHVLSITSCTHGFCDFRLNTLTGPDTLQYRFTIDDPTAFTRTWTGEIIMSRAPGPLYEYACHEANYSLTDILAGARAEEKHDRLQGRGTHHLFRGSFATAPRPADPD